MGENTKHNPRRQQTRKEMIARRMKVADDMAKGINSSTQIAVRHGVAVSTACNDMKAVIDHWLAEMPERMDRRVAIQVERHLKIYRDASNDYELSKWKEVKDADGDVKTVRTKGNVSHQHIMLKALGAINELWHLKDFVVDVGGKVEHEHEHRMVDLKERSNEEILEARIVGERFRARSNGQKLLENNIGNS